MELCHAVLLLLILRVQASYQWQKHRMMSLKMPGSVEIFILRNHLSAGGQNLTGALAKIDMNDSSLEFRIRDSLNENGQFKAKKLHEFAEQGNFVIIEDENVVYAVLNGGYYNEKTNESRSFIVQDGQVRSVNHLNFFKGSYPTLGAFGLTKEGKFEAGYIYSYEDHKATYIFNKTNDLNSPPPKDQGRPWKVQEAIGGGPLLIKNKQIINKNLQHFRKLSFFQKRHPRSAICIDANNVLYLVAIDGRSKSSKGLSMTELGHLMNSLACQNALNLDGGGSTALYAGGAIVNRPCLKRGDRAVGSAIVIRDRYKKKDQRHQLTRS